MCVCIFSSLYAYLYRHILNAHHTLFSFLINVKWWSFKCQRYKSKTILLVTFLYVYFLSLQTMLGTFISYSWNSLFQWLCNIEWLEHHNQASDSSVDRQSSCFQLWPLRVRLNTLPCPCASIVSMSWSFFPVG